MHAIEAGVIFTFDPLLERDDRLDVVRRHAGNEVGQVRVGEALQWNDLRKVMRAS